MNSLDEFNYINNLYEIYKSLLTDKQIKIMDKYYLYNLSFGEIAEEEKISRSAVCDTIEHAKEKLEEYENKLHILKKNDKIKAILVKNDIDDKIKKEILEVLYYGI